MHRSTLLPHLRVLTLFISALTLCLTTARGAAARATSTPDFAAIDSHVQDTMRALRIPGLALAIVQGDQIVHLTGFGVAGPMARR